MAYSVNWATKVVTIPKVDLTVLSVSPEIYALDVLAFWSAIHDIQDGVGMPYLDIMRSNAPVVLSGVTYARSVEVVNGYKIEFQDGEYQVNLINANNNILDARVQNNVSINASNSAGLVGSGGLTPAQASQLESIYNNTLDIKSTVDVLPSAIEIASAVWNAEAVEFTVNGTMGDELMMAIAKIAEVYQIQGLDEAAPMTVTPSSRISGAIALALTGDGINTTTVTRQ